ncbi:MAG TPA: alanine racemase [Terriglobales bacterium]|nr:alanine racemase [Terriglobales bacterium]
MEISRGALRHNLDYVRSRLGAGTQVCAVVKADAYGHGAGECARVFTAAGAPWLAVTSVEEGVRLRAGVPAARILVLAGFFREEAAALVEHRLTPAVWDAAQIEWLAAAAGREKKFALHLKLETGMGRLGVTAEQEAGVRAALAAAPQLQVEAVFSHLAASEAAEEAPSREQRRRLGEAGNGQAWHLLNSEGALRYPEWGGMLVRSGLALYGYSAQPEHAARLRPALQWKTRVVGVKELPAGHGVGYGPHFRTPRRMRVATLAAGYADGYRRDFSPGAAVRVHGNMAPVVGAVSMDLTMVDVSQVPEVKLGDEAVLLGEGVGATTLAAVAGTIPYEVLCGISARVERGYAD